MLSISRFKVPAFLLLVFVTVSVWFYNPAGVVADENNSGKGEQIQVDIMSYNIAHGEGMDDVLDLQRVGDVIKDSGADIIGLQEVDRHWSERSNLEDQAKWLAEYLDMHYVYGANLDLDPAEEGNPRRQYGTAVLSKYPILDSENHLLTQIIEPGGHNEQRGLLETVINVKGSQLHFFNTHLGLKKEERLLNIEEIKSIIAKSDKKSVIVGDFNANPWDEEIQQITDVFADVFAELGMDDTYTYPTRYVDPITGEETEPTKRIDYIFSDKDLKVENAGLIETSASDHMPIMARFMLDREVPYDNGN
ncbi:endonuclease/exonuclease/phosphatase family protein [Thalassobacillus sp. B23F22_16]|uniref:endonuclease/exonuclease/phosphatase family protein n=1 Tax=Thalassobacillus sp. B23F22_16 TaxID=3459513 RepID=UPI00373E0450